MVSNKKVLLFAIVCGLIAVVATNMYITQLKAKIDTIQMVKIVVAKTSIPNKTEITSDMLEYKEIAKDYVHQQAFYKKEEVIGSITKTPIIQGESVLKDKIVKTGDTQDGLAYTVPKGMRAITVGINNVTGVGGLLKPGDKVDLIGLMNVKKTLPNGDIETLAVTKISLQDLQVLAVGKKLDENEKVPEAQNGQETSQTKTVTLSVKPNDGEKITLLNETGIIRLMLRSPIDDGKATPMPYSVYKFAEE